eukprot:Phypoly_transcript_03655.p1 GENE.Phypoly_transcript_03655~~Phypoly_transcript_03655.p1  ORF type:complete len:704 (+),score=96.89 Phypoly_transcript_03655:68-2113(+)
MEFDLWIPKYHLCFEFQDDYHYTTAWYFHSTKQAIFQKDILKHEKARAKGMDLVHIPCWWDGSVAELVLAICFLRPDLHLVPEEICDPFSLNPPRDFFESEANTAMGELMLVSHPHYNFTPFPDSWWIGEKYDGIRCFWNFASNICYTRYGNEISLLPSVVKMLPQICTDNELWFGRGRFYDACLLVKSDLQFQWPMLRMITFDMPRNKMNFERRYQKVLQTVPQDHPYNLLVYRMLLLPGFKTKFVKNVIKSGGEGVILQKCESVYEPGRSPSLVKLKTSRGDQEAIVIGIGSNKSATLKLPNEQIFEVSPENILVSNLAVGDIVSFSHETHSRRDTPVNPKIIRIRCDITWQNVMHDFLHTSYDKKAFTSKPIGYWNTENARKHMESFAIDLNLNPLVPDTWIKIGKSFCKSKFGKTILGKFKNSLYNTLQSVFPDVNFSIRSFQRYIWSKATNRRKFFEEFATSQKFDPLVPENWYDGKRITDLRAVKGLRGVLLHHENDLAKALLDLFPDIGLDGSKILVPKPKWNNPEKRRKFLEKFAKENGFDPLNENAWSKQSKRKFLRSPMARKVISFHKNSISRALRDLFPQIFFQSEKAVAKNLMENKIMISKNYEGRKFFEDYAKENQFDPHKPANWYLQSSYRIMKAKQAQNVLSLFGNSVPHALAQLFPEIGLDVAKL